MIKFRFWRKRIVKRDFNLSDISVNKDVALIIRLRNPTFSRLLLFLFIKFGEEDFIYTTDVSNFLKKTQSYAYNLLKDFEKFGLVYREIVTSNLVMWKPVLNSKDPLLNKYVKYAKKTIGIG